MLPGPFLCVYLRNGIESLNNNRLEYITLKVVCIDGFSGKNINKHYVDKT